MQIAWALQYSKLVRKHSVGLDGTFPQHKGKDQQLRCEDDGRIERTARRSNSQSGWWANVGWLVRWELHSNGEFQEPSVCKWLSEASESTWKEAQVWELGLKHRIAIACYTFELTNRICVSHCKSEAIHRKPCFWAVRGLIVHRTSRWSASRQFCRRVQDSQGKELEGVPW